MQFPDRYKWYEAKFAADDMPDWNPGTFVAMEQEAPGGAALPFVLFLPLCAACLFECLSVILPRPGVRPHAGAASAVLPSCHCMKHSCHHDQH